jgi:hypothetical protein
VCFVVIFLFIAKYSDPIYLQFVHLGASTRPWSVAKLIEAYQLRAPDFILSIQTSSVYDNDLHKQKSGIQAKTERAIYHGLADTARITRE